MNLEGVIAELYETWPLQLNLRTSTGQYLVALSEQTKVIRGKRSVPAAQLKPGMMVKISGTLTGDKAIAAQSITVQ